MLKKVLISFIFIISIIHFSDLTYANTETYKIIKIIDADTFYLDFNRDGYAQKDEKIRLKNTDVCAFFIIPPVKS